MVRVDQPGDDGAVGRVDDLVRLEILRDGGDDVADAMVFDQDVMGLELFDPVVSRSNG